MENFKEVYFDMYCKSCKYQEKEEDQSPCYECLEVPARENSHKPIKYEERKNGF